jgi:hypothetical protein
MSAGALLAVIKYHNVFELYFILLFTNNSLTFAYLCENVYISASEIYT